MIYFSALYPQISSNQYENRSFHSDDYHGNDQVEGQVQIVDRYVELFEKSLTEPRCSPDTKSTGDFSQHKGNQKPYNRDQAGPVVGLCKGLGYHGVDDHR